MNNVSGKIRVSTLAHAIGCQSKDIVQVINLTRPSLNVKSASSRLEINRDNILYYQSVAAFARLRRDARDSRFRIV